MPSSWVVIVVRPHRFREITLINKDTGFARLSHVAVIMLAREVWERVAGRGTDAVGGLS